MTDQEYMFRAIQLAKKGEGWTNPNPMVGAVIVKDGRIIGEGYHKKCGELHAERNAIASLTESAEGATIYVTLEPCCHYGKTPPCTEAIIEQKIKKVVIGSRDPNPKVAGKGAQILRELGITVVQDFMREECDCLNPVFFHYITTKTPYVVMKYAMTLDGKIATKTGASKWITGEPARQEVQHMRHRYMGIMAGIGTVLADDPMLNVRVEGWKSPVRIVCDSSLRIPLDSQIVRSAKEYRTIVAYAGREENEEITEKIERLHAKGVDTVCCPDEKGQIDLKKLMTYLGNEGIDSILLEGGGTLNDSALRAGIVKEVHCFIAPKLFGGKNSKTPVQGIGIGLPSEALKLKCTDICRIGEDIRIICQVCEKEQEGPCLLRYMQLTGESGVLAVKAKKVLERTKIGDSIAVNGVCLTVTSLQPDGFTADVMAETVRRSSLGSCKAGSQVNLERAMAADGRFGGHIVSGHIDGTGVIRSLIREENAIWVSIGTSPQILHLIVEKGSICIDGISLTVAKVDEEGFQVSVIPHTGEETTLLEKVPGDPVNLETDVVGKYIEKLLRPEEPKPRTTTNESTLTKEMLLRCGF